MYFLTLLYVITSPLALNHCTYILVGFLFQVQVLSSLFSDEEIRGYFPSSTLSDKIPQSHMVLMSKTGKQHFRTCYDLLCFKTHSVSI